MTPRRLPMLVLVAASLLLGACGSSGASSTSTSGQASGPAPTSSTPATTSGGLPPPNNPGPEGIPLEQGPELAPASTTTPGTTVDGIQCAPLEQLVYHIHAHLQVYLDGQPQTLPAAIGMIEPIYEETPYGRFYGARKCYYWLHTHASDGVIHVESPSKRIYTLGNFFDEWRQPLSWTEVAGAKGKVTAFFNSKPWTQNPRTIPLLPHAVIQLDVGSPTPPPQAISWAGTSL